ncbi:M23 family metallopeptidase [Cardiobacteriaceae bacterium TAE3-ERU3]|nr:M23 family metallopeptidase [Cardiobacteriaceae bacterium TAE3-ERU3]
MQKPTVIDRARRAISGITPLPFWLFIGWIGLAAALNIPPHAPFFTVFVLLLAMMFIQPRKVDYDPVEITSPVQGTFMALNSPADKVPSHGTRHLGQTWGIDFLHRREDFGTVPWCNGFRPATSFSSFGEPVYAVADGVVVSCDQQLNDHRSRSSYPALLFMMTLEALVRSILPPRFTLGNHIVIDHGNGVYSLYAHLRKGSAWVKIGDSISQGAVIAEIGNTGNSSEPHLHFQLMDRKYAASAAGIPFQLSDIRDEEGNRIAIPETGKCFSTAGAKEL